jgi:hypothetical protein
MLLFSGDYLLFMLPAFIIVMVAQWWVSSTYRKWGKVENRAGLTGAEAAKRLLQYGGVSDVSLDGIPGRLTDHYDPRDHTLRLSAGVANGRSVASLAIAAHEIGHAIQDKHGYAPLRFRAALVPIVNYGSRLGVFLILIGLVLRSVLGTQLAWVGVGMFGLGAVFSLATLPVELNASARARVLLSEAGILQTSEEQQGVRSVLTAAAFTYVAALAAAILQLLYWASFVGGGRRRN